MGEDGDPDQFITDEMRELAERLNTLIMASGPCSYTPSKIRTTYKENLKTTGNDNSR